MFNIDSTGIITMTRGDSFAYPLIINRGTKLYPEHFNWHAKYAENSKLYFGVMMPEQRFDDAIVRKVYTKDDADKFGNILVSFCTKDTEHLVPGTYYYEVKLLKVYSVNGVEHQDIETVKEKRKFIILD